jgi:regulator of protease activity HflC (stomatin/prohibitin superfamily)
MTNAAFDDLRQVATEAQVGPPPVPPPGPIAQSVAIGFRAVYIATLLMCIVWLASNVRQIPPDSQAVVLRFGGIVRTQDAGLLLGWPRPIEQVYLLPGVDRLLSQTVTALPSVSALPATAAAPVPASDEAAANADTYLTGDGGVVLLDATLIYRITDPRAFMLAERHVAPALNRVFHATAVRVTARRSLNDFLVARPNAEGADAGQAASPMSAALRDELLKGVAARLQIMSAAGSPLGVEVDRIDLTARLPPVAKVAFDSVLTATQAADQNVATARTQAERRRQGAERERDRLLSSARATATEHITTARVDTASIRALENELRAVENEGTSQTRDSLLQRVYRDRVAGIIGRIGTMSLVDPQSGARYVMPGRQ